MCLNNEREKFIHERKKKILTLKLMFSFTTLQHHNTSKICIKCCQEFYMQHIYACVVACKIIYVCIM